MIKLKKNFLVQNPLISSSEIAILEQRLNLSPNKLKYFFKNQKTKALKKLKLLSDSQEIGSYKIFGKKDKEILETKFKINNKLDTDILIEL